MSENLQQVFPFVSNSSCPQVFCRYFPLSTLNDVVEVLLITPLWRYLNN
ncbi:MAG: hypothetical protein V7L20_09445 [Nostoc sp.]